MFRWSNNHARINDSVVSIVGKDKGQYTNSTHNTDVVVRLLEKELSNKNVQLAHKDAQISFLQEQVIIAQSTSQRAKAISHEIPNNAKPYARGLKSLAEGNFEQAKMFLVEAETDGNTSLIQVFIARGDVEYYNNHYSAALFWYKKAVTLQPVNIIALRNMGITQMCLNQNANAEKTLSRTLSLQSKAFYRKDTGTADVVNALSLVYIRLKQYIKAKPLLLKTFNAWEEQSDEGKWFCWMDYQFLVMFYVDDNNYESVLNISKSALQYSTQTWGFSTMYNVVCLNNIGIAQQGLKDYDNALATYKKKAYSLCRTLQGEQSSFGANIVRNIGLVYRDQGNLDVARGFLQRALLVQEAVLGSDQPNVAMILDDLGMIDEQTGRYGESEISYKRAFEIRAKKLGLDSRLTARSCLGYSHALRAMGKNAEASRLENQAISIFEASEEKRLKVPQEDHPH